LAAMAMFCRVGGSAWSKRPHHAERRVRRRHCIQDMHEILNEETDHDWPR
jgi:hypothetical protein